MTSIGPAVERVAARVLRPNPDYPVHVIIPAASRQSRLSLALRPIFGIPLVGISLVLEAVASTLVVIPWVVIVVAGRYPPRLRDLAVAALRWHARARAYLLLLTGEFPPLSFAGDPVYPVQLEVDPELLPRRRWTVLLRPLLAIPHLIVLVVIEVAGLVLLVVTWPIAIVLGRVPVRLHLALARAGKHAMRFRGYALLLTDEYPPLRLR